MTTSNTAEIRKLKLTELDAVLRIEAESFQRHLNERELRELLKGKGVFGKVLVYHKQMLAFIVYKMHKDHVEILRIAVTDKCRSKGIGQQLLAWMKGSAKKADVKRIYVRVRDTNEAAQKFFDKCGFVVSSVEWEQPTWDDKQETDIYNFVYYLDWMKAEHPASLLSEGLVDEVMTTDVPQTTE